MSLSGADPLNLVGVLTPGAQLPALTGNRVVYRDGAPVGSLSGRAVEIDGDLTPPSDGRRNAASCARRPRA